MAKYRKTRRPVVSGLAFEALEPRAMCALDLPIGAEVIAGAMLPNGHILLAGDASGAAKTWEFDAHGHFIGQRDLTQDAEPHFASASLASANGQFVGGVVYQYPDGGSQTHYGYWDGATPAN